MPRLMCCRIEDTVDAWFRYPHVKVFPNGKDLKTIVSLNSDALAKLTNIWSLVFFHDPWDYSIYCMRLPAS